MLACPLKSKSFNPRRKLLMPDAALEDLAVHQLCTFAARRKALVRLANVASAGGRKRNNDFAPLRNIFNEWLVRDTSKKRKGPALAQEPGCGAIGCYSTGGVHRSLLPPEEPPEEPPLLPPSSGAGGTTSGVWRRVAEAA